MRIDEQRSTADQLQRHIIDVFNRMSLESPELKRARAHLAAMSAAWRSSRDTAAVGAANAEVERLAASLPTLTDASPAQHASAAARIVADMNGGGL